MLLLRGTGGATRDCDCDWQEDMVRHKSIHAESVRVFTAYVGTPKGLDYIPDIDTTHQIIVLAKCSS
jgi:hypothetical protein